MAPRESIIACEVQPGGEPSLSGLPMVLAEKLQDFRAERRHVASGRSAACRRAPLSDPPIWRQHCSGRCGAIATGWAPACFIAFTVSANSTCSTPSVANTAILPRFDFGPVVSSDAVCRQTTLRSGSIGTLSPCARRLRFLALVSQSGKLAEIALKLCLLDPWARPRGSRQLPRASTFLHPDQFTSAFPEFHVSSMWPVVFFPHAIGDLANARLSFRVSLEWVGSHDDLLMGVRTFAGRATDSVK